MGYGLNDLKEVFPPYSPYNKTKQEKYTIDVKNEEEAKKIFKFDIKGFRAIDVYYRYPDDNPIDHPALTAKALEDAKSKAEAMAAQANKRVGNILNIDDKSPNSIIISSNIKQPEYNFNYTLNITFELLDK